MTDPRQTEPPRHSPESKPKKPHPNRLPFEGYLSSVGQISAKPPGGSRGHLVLLTAAAAQDGMESLEGMSVDYKEGWGGHNPRQKCGVINRAELRGDKLWVCGYLYDRDFPEVARAIRELDMGMSWDVIEVHIEDMRAEVWTINCLTFCGASILLRMEAAYSASKIWIPE